MPVPTATSPCSVGVQASVPMRSSGAWLRAWVLAGFACRVLGCQNGCKQPGRTRELPNEEKRALLCVRFAPNSQGRGLQHPAACHCRGGTAWAAACLPLCLKQPVGGWNLGTQNGVQAVPVSFLFGRHADSRQLRIFTNCSRCDGGCVSSCLGVKEGNTCLLRPTRLETSARSEP